MPTFHRLRAIAPAVAGVVAASALLSGCLGDDKDDKGAKAPSVTSTAPSTGKPSAPSSEAPGGTTKPTGSSTSTSTADVIDAFKYKTGQCLQTDGRKTDEVSCSKPHNGQVGKAFDLPESVRPDTPGYADKVSDLCEEYIGAVVDKQPASAGITFSYTYPLDMQSWRNGQHQAACIYQREDQKDLPALVQ